MPVESCRVIENPTTNRRNTSLSEFGRPKIIDHRKNSFVERTEQLRNFSKGSGAHCTNESWFNRISVKLPNSAKKWKTRTTKIMELIKRMMKFQ